MTPLTKDSVTRILRVAGVPMEHGAKVTVAGRLIVVEHPDGLVTRAQVDDQEVITYLKTQPGNVLDKLLAHGDWELKTKDCDPPQLWPRQQDRVTIHRESKLFARLYVHVEPGLTLQTGLVPLPRVRGKVNVRTELDGRSYALVVDLPGYDEGGLLLPIDTAKEIADGVEKPYGGLDIQEPEGSGYYPPSK